MPNFRPSPRSPAGGGAFLVLGLIGGAIVGFALGQPTIGFLVGGGLGLAVLGWLAWRDR